MVEAARSQVHNNLQLARQPIYERINREGVPLDGFGYALACEYDKGYAGGVELFQYLPESLYDDLKAIVEKLEQEEEDEREDDDGAGFDESGDNPDNRGHTSP